MRDVFDQPHRIELADSLANWHRAEVQGLGNLLYVQPLSRFERSGHDSGVERCERFLGQGPVPTKWSTIAQLLDELIIDEPDYRGRQSYRATLHEVSMGGELPTPT